MVGFFKFILAAFLVLSLGACSLFRGSEPEEGGAPTDVGFTEEGAVEEDFSFGEGTDSGFAEDDDFFAFGEDDEDAFGGDFSSDSGADSAATDSASGDDLFGGADFFGDDTFPEAPLDDTTQDYTMGDTAQDYTTGDTALDGGASDAGSFGADSFGSTDFGSDDLFASGDVESGSDALSDTPEKTFVPVKKMEAQAFSRGGAKLNRIYIVRQGESLGDISQKIFGSDRVSEISQWNSYFQRREPNVGDKIYYPSPNNPGDDRMLTYYEDQNIPHQTYVTEAGDNIRTVSKRLLGHDRSWMEVWATNLDVDSKDVVDAGVALRYWPGDVVAAPTMAAAPAPAPPVEDDPFGDFGSPPPPTDDFAAMMEDEPSSGPPPTSSLGGLDDPMDDDPFGSPSESQFAPPPPPPPRQELNLPPPPPPTPRAAPPTTATAGEGMDDDMLIYGAVAALVLLGLIVLMIKRRRREDMGHTQV